MNEATSGHTVQMLLTKAATGLLGAVPPLRVDLVQGTETIIIDDMVPVASTEMVGAYSVTFTAPAVSNDTTFNTVWKNTGAGADPVEQLLVHPAPTALPTPPPSVMPTTADVATVIMSYAKDGVGAYVGDFTTDTIPTAAQVNRIAAQVAEDVFADIDTDIPEESWGAVRTLIAIGTAMRVVLSFYPEAASGPRSPYDNIKTLYDQQMLRVEKSLLREQTELISGEQGAPVLYSFPDVDDLWTRAM